MKVTLLLALFLAEVITSLGASKVPETKAGRSTQLQTGLKRKHGARLLLNEKSSEKRSGHKEDIPKDVLVKKTPVLSKGRRDDVSTPHLTVGPVTRRTIKLRPNRSRNDKANEESDFEAPLVSGESDSSDGDKSSGELNENETVPAKDDDEVSASSPYSSLSQKSGSNKRLGVTEQPTSSGGKEDRGKSKTRSKSSKARNEDNKIQKKSSKVQHENKKPRSNQSQNLAFASPRNLDQNRQKRANSGSNNLVPKLATDPTVEKDSLEKWIGANRMAANLLNLKDNYFAVLGIKSADPEIVKKQAKDKYKVLCQFFRRPEYSDSYNVKEALKLAEEAKCVLTNEEYLKIYLGFRLIYRRDKASSEWKRYMKENKVCPNSSEVADI